MHEAPLQTLRKVSTVRDLCLNERTVNDSPQEDLQDFNFLLYLSSSCLRFLHMMLYITNDWEFIYSYIHDS